MNRLVLAVGIISAFLVPSRSADAQCTVNFQHYLLQGPFGGQAELDGVQYRSAGYTQCFNTHPTWCTDLTPGIKVVGAFHKSYWMSSSSGAWLGCANGPAYVHNLKSSDGRVVEYACADYVDDAAELTWEVLPSNPLDKPRIFWRNESGYWKRGARWANFNCQPSDSLSATVRRRFWSHLYVGQYQCQSNGTYSHVSSSYPKSAATFLGPILINSSTAASVASSLKSKGLVPSSMPTSEVIPASWYSSMPNVAGRAGQPVYLLIREDFLDLYCGTASCKNWVETYWYLSVSPDTSNQFGLGLVRWNVRSLNTGLFYREVVFDTLVKETGAKTLARPLCQQ